MKARVTQAFVASFEDSVFQPAVDDVIEDPFASFCISNGLPVEAIADESAAPAPEVEPSVAPEPASAPEPIPAPVPDPSAAPAVVETSDAPLEQQPPIEG